MLDAYIIDRIRREQEQRDRKDARVPLYIDDGPRSDQDQQRRREDDKPDDRGSVIIDYSA